MVLKVLKNFSNPKKLLYGYKIENSLQNMQKTIDDIDFEKSDGLVPVIVQDVNSKEVLTLAYTNKESLKLALKTKKSWFYSRSRNKLWMKGEESGNTQSIKEILVDCDSDAIIYLVEPSGPACHTGEKNCFHNFL
jgi:phosphoribosyl-AMP cyclohydrolase